MMEAHNFASSLQDRYASRSICFGCGPANASGLRIKSYPDAEGGSVTAEWQPGPHHEAFPGMVNGGIIGSLLDCHSNWTAAWHLMNKNGWDRPQCTVTAKYSVELLAPTPSGAPLSLRARVVDAGDRRATVEAELSSGGTVTAKCTGIFVVVKPGHPAYHRWD
jgi:acyl-coenzyme A thioesterase PaaI-like protein